MFTAVAELRSGELRRAQPAIADCILRMIRRLAMVLAATLLAGATSTAGTAQPTYVYILLGGFVGLDGFVDSDGMLLLARRIANIPNTWVESYTWADWITAANRLWARPGKDGKVVVIGYSGGGSRATWLANSVLHKNIDLLVTYDPSPSWQMQNLPPNVKKAITYQNQVPFFGLGGGVLTGPDVTRVLVTEDHLAVQFDERLHQMTLQAIEELAK